MSWEHRGKVNEGHLRRGQRPLEMRHRRSINGRMIHQRPIAKVTDVFGWKEGSLASVKYRRFHTIHNVPS